MKFRFIITLTVALALLATPVAYASANDGPASDRIPQIDCSTARIPITNAIYDLFTGKYSMTGPEPVCSKTHGAWLSLADRTADIIFLIGPTEDEFAYFAERGIDIELKVFGYDGLVFIGNDLNPIDNLTSEQIRSIYRGEINNWNKLPGGFDADVVVYVREPESGSQRLFESLVWAGLDMPDFQNMRYKEGEVDPAVSQREKRVTIFDDMDQITISVMVNQFSIGFNIMSFIDSEYLSQPGAETGGWKVTATAEVNLRSGPGLDHKNIASIKTGASLPYLNEFFIDDRSVTWYKAQHESKGIVWVSSRYSKLEGASAPKLKLFSVDGFAPTTENFASGSYPFLTTSYVVIRADEPADSPARRLYDWVGSEESRELISENSTLSVAFSDSVVLRTHGRDPNGNASLALVIEKLDREVIKRSELYEFTQEELGYLRQGIYALSGKIFSQAKYDEFFSYFNWYEGTGGSDKELYQTFNEFQLANYDIIAGYQREVMRANANRSSDARTLSFTKGVALMKGDDVALVQNALAAQGYLAPADCDGVYGQKTANAVSAFQADNMLNINGAVDKETRMFLIE